MYTLQIVYRTAKSGKSYYAGGIYHEDTDRLSILGFGYEFCQHKLGATPEQLHEAYVAGYCNIAYVDYEKNS